jgi:transposase
MKNFLTVSQIKLLEERHRQSKEKRQADRIKTILCLNMGDSYEEIAKRLLLDDSTLRNYYAEYVNKGMEELLKDNYKGGKSRLDYCQIEALDKHLQTHTYTSSKDIQAYIEKEYGVHYTTEGVKGILYRLGFSYKKSKHVPGKADRKMQEDFLKEYESLKSSKQSEDKIYFMDGCHPIHNSIEAYGWIKKGQEKQLKANTGRKRLNINGAYNAEDNKVIVREDESVNANSTISLIQQIMVLQTTGIIYIIADNARYYRSKLVRECLEKNTRVKLIFLPPYSPNLNLIERLWLFFKKKRLWNKYYERYEEFKQECMAFFENICLYENELKTLMTDNFRLLQSA